MTSDEQIRHIISRELNVPIELVQPDTVLAELPGFDSVQLIMLMVAVEEAGVKIPTAEVANLRTVGSILQFVRQ